MSKSQLSASSVFQQMHKDDPRWTGYSLQILLVSSGPTLPTVTAHIDEPAARAAAAGQVRYVHAVLTCAKASASVLNWFERAQKSLDNAAVQYIPLI